MCSRRRNAPSVPTSLQRSASASKRRFSLPENWRRLAITTTSGSRRGGSSETVSPVAIRAPSVTASEEESDNPFIELFSNAVMCMSYLYSKLPETGVSPHIGTGGGRKSGSGLKPPQAAVVKSDGGERCGNAGTRFRQAKLREASASKPLMTCRKAIRRCQNRGLTLPLGSTRGNPV